MLIDLYNTSVELIHKVASDLAQGQDMATGMIIVAILGSIGYMGKNIPMKIIKFILGRTTVKIQADDHWSGAKQELYIAMSAFIAKHQMTRSFRVTSATVDRTELGTVLKLIYGLVPSFGMFFYKGRPFIYGMNEATEMGAVPANVFIQTLGRDPDKVIDLMKVESTVQDNYKNRRFYERHGDEWRKVGTIMNSPPIFLPKEIKEKLDAKIDFFINNRAWYAHRGISHKLLIILEGPPGTGKSRIARYVSDRLNYSLGTILTAGHLTAACREATSENIVVSIPDVDSVGIGRARVNMRGKSPSSSNKPKKAAPNTDSKDDTSVNPFAGLLSDDTLLAEALNLFEGDIPINNLVCVMSTNCIESIDEAMLRPSRCDLVLSINSLSYTEVNDFYKHSYEIDEDIGEEFKDIAIKACDLSNAFTGNAFDKEGFKKALTEFI